MVRHDAELLELVIEGPPQRPTVRLCGDVGISNTPKLLHDWLARLVTRRVPLEAFGDAFSAPPDDVKVVITLDATRT